MRNSPFAIFRKHQKALMVALTLMAMFAFVFLDAVQRNYRSRTSVADDTAVQTSAGNLTQNDLGNLIARRQAANRFVQEVFRVTHPELAQMGAMFFQQQLQRLMFGFGRTPIQQDVLLGHLLRLEAQQHGIIVSDQQIESYLDRISENKLTSSQFKQIVSSQRLTSKQAYDFLRDELQARMALQMEMPFNPLPPEQYWRYYQQLNVKQQLEVAAIPIREKADSEGKTPPAIIDQVADPGDAELEKFFEQHKSTFEQFADDGKGLQPGFRQPRRVHLHYVALDYKSVEAAVAKSDPVTDEQIAEHYEKNKDALYRVSTLPAIDDKKDETKPLDPEFTPEKNGKDKPTDGDSKKADDKKPDDSKKLDEKKSDDPKLSDDKPAEKPETKDEKKPADEEKSPEELKDDKQSSLPLPSGAEGRREGGERQMTSALPFTSILRAGEALALLVADDEQPAEKKAVDNGEGKLAEEKPAVKSASDSIGAEKKPELPEKKDSADSKPATEKKSDDETPPPPPAPKYRELDDDLKQEIRERLQRERTLVVLRKKSEDVAAAMRDVGLTLLTQHSLADVAEDRLDDQARDTSSPYHGFDLARLKAEQQKQLGVIAETSKSRLDEIAAKHGGTYGDTGSVSAQQLSELKGLGEAAEHSDNPFQRGADIVEQAFSSRSLCIPQVAEAATTNDLYVHWKVRDDADYVASFMDSTSGQPDPAIRKQVLDAWKFQQAQPLAKKRAEALAELARKGDATKSLKELLADQTVSGNEGSPALAVNETPAFSWLRESSAPMSNPFASRPPPQMSSPAFVDRPGTEFMETVFNKLNPGEIGVAANMDHSIYYVVKVTIRNEPDHAAFMKANLFGGAMGFFFATPYDQLASREQQQANYEWSVGLEKKYAVKWSDKAAERMATDFEE